mgnify:FL=1
MSLLVILLMGWAVYMVITSPLITLVFLFKAFVVMVLGIIAWFGLILILI